MKNLLVFALVFAPAAAAAGFAQPPAAAPGARPGADPNQIVCRTIRETGSRLNAHRVCMTQAQWAELRRETREQVDKAQMSRVRPGGM